MAVERSAHNEVEPKNGSVHLRLGGEDVRVVSPDVARKAASNIRDSPDCSPDALEFALEIVMAAEAAERQR